MDTSFKVAGSGHIVLHNFKFIEEVPLSTNHSIIPSPLHNYPKIQNNPHIQSKYMSTEMNIRNEPQNEPNIKHDTPLIKLPRALQRIDNFDKASLKD